MGKIIGKAKAFRHFSGHAMTLFFPPKCSPKQSGFKMPTYIFPDFIKYKF